MKIPKKARQKILTLEKACLLARSAQRRAETVVFTNGCFDLIHVGHIRSLEQARSLGDHLIVAINSDASARSIKGNSRPILPAQQRAETVAALACVDWVILFRALTPLKPILALKPDVLAKGGEWPRSEIVGSQKVKSWGGRVVRLRVIPGVRTSYMIDRIRSN